MRKLKLFLSLLMLLAFSVGNVWGDSETIATGTFNGKNGTYTDGWSTTGTGKSRTDCIIIGSGENITSPEVDLSNYESVTISIKARRYGSLSGGKATIAVSFSGVSLGTTDATGTSATTSLKDIEYTIEEATAKTGTFVFTCTNATSVGSTHGAGINTITISGVKKAAAAKPAVSIDSEITGGTLVITNDGVAVESGAEIDAETVLVATATPDDSHKNPVVTIKDENGSDVTEEVLYDASTGEFLMPNYNITVSASFTAKAVSAVNITNPDHGTITVTGADLNAVMEGTELTVSGESTSEAYSFGTISATTASNVPVAITNGKLIMPAEAVNITATETKRNEVHVAVEVLNSADEVIETPAGIGATVNGGSVAYLDDEAMVNLVATPIAGYNFTGWTVTGEGNSIDQNTAESTTGTVYADGTFTAHFEATSVPQIEVTPSSLSFGAVAPDSEVEQTLTITGSNITGNVTLALDAEMADAFTLSATSFTAEQVMAQGGVTVTVTPKTNTIGTFENEITISSEGVESVTVQLNITVNKRTPDLAWKLNDEVITSESDPVVVYIGEKNTFPTLYNPHNLAVEYWSNIPSIADINSTDGTITLKKPSTQTPVIHAQFEKTDEYSAADVTYLLKVQQRYTAKWYVNGDVIKTQTALPDTTLEFPADPKATGDCEGLVFRGWAESELASKTDEAPACTKLTAMPETDVNFYAVFATETSTSTDQSLSVDFESETSDYTDWTFTNLTTKQTNSNVNAHGGDYFGTTGGKASGSVVTASKIASPQSVTFYISKTSTNTKPSSWLVKVSSDGDTWTTVGDEQDASENITRGVWTEVTRDLSSYSDVYVGVFYDGTTAVRTIDDVALTAGGTTTSYSGYLTTCESCSMLTLTKSATENGTYTLSATSVRTCDGVTTVDVTFAPAEGYELASFSVEQVNGVSYEDGVITIAQGVNGNVQTGATFKLADYTVTMAQTGDAEATLSEDQTGKHMGDEITVTAEDKDGYVFLGWEADPAVTFADASALTTTFDMPNGNVTVTAKYAKILTVAEAIALIPNTNDTYDNAIVEAYITEIGSYNSTYSSLTYDVQALDANGFPIGDALQVYSGKGLNGADFSAESDIAVGAKVLVFGQLKNYKGTPEFNSNNYQLAYTAKGDASVVVYGAASKTEYYNNQAFEFDGLSAKLLYANGYAEAIDSPVWAADPANVTASGTVYVTATYNNQTSVAFPVEVTKVLREASINWSETEADAYLSGHDYELPTVNNPNSLSLTYSTADTNIASVDESGNVTLNAAGITEVYVSFAGNDEYAAVEKVAYTLRVFAIDEVVVTGEAAVTNYEAGEDFSTDGLQATAYYACESLTRHEFDVTKEAVWTVEPANIAAGTEKVTVSATWNGKTGTRDITVSVATHAVAFVQPENGTISVFNGENAITSGDQFAKGTVLTVEAAANDDYKLAALTVNGTDILAAKQFEIGKEPTYTVSATFAEKAEANISWSAETAEAKMPVEVFTNEYPTLANEDGLTVSYKSSATDVAVIDAETGAISLVGAGEAVISAIFAGDDDHKAKTVSYTLTVTAVTPNFYITGTAVGGWNADQVAVYESTSYTITGLEANTEYKLKVTLDGTWDESQIKGFFNLTQIAAGLYSDDDINICFKLAEAGDVTVTYTDEAYTVTGNFAMPEIKFEGAWDAWEDHIAAESQDGTYASVTIYMVTGTYDFGVHVGGKYRANNYTFHRDYNTISNLIDYEDGNMHLRVDKAGNYTFTWDYATNTMVITFPDYYSNYTVAGQAALLNSDWNIDDEENLMSKQEDGTYLLMKYNLTLAEGTYKYKIVAEHSWDNNWPSEDAELVITKQGLYNVRFTLDASDIHNGNAIVNAEAIYLGPTPATAIDNTEAGEQVVKSIENGVLIIRRGDKSYNAQGALLK